ncbi:MAG: tyrosine-protein phosphatase [Bryobacteraceae bacterium]|jgi:uncharacterized protein (TIGR01244 family)
MNYGFVSKWYGCASLLVAFSAFGASAASLPLPGVVNFQKVDDQVYRGAQPTDVGFASLAHLGIKTVVDLRSIGEHSQADEQRLVEAAGMHYVSVPMKGMTSPSSDDVAKVLAMFNDSADGPVFVHCRRGADRTGAVIACYRIGHDHWDNKQALSEARALGMSWYQRALQNFVLHFQATPVLASATIPAH